MEKYPVYTIENLNTIYGLSTDGLMNLLKTNLGVSDVSVIFAGYLHTDMSIDELCAESSLDVCGFEKYLSTGTRKIDFYTDLDSCHVNYTDKLNYFQATINTDFFNKTLPHGRFYVELEKLPDGNIGFIYMNQKTVYVSPSWSDATIGPAFVEVVEETESTALITGSNIIFGESSRDAIIQSALEFFGDTHLLYSCSIIKVCTNTRGIYYALARNNMMRSNNELDYYVIFNDALTNMTNVVKYDINQMASELSPVLTSLTNVINDIILDKLGNDLVNRIKKFSDGWVSKNTPKPISDSIIRVKTNNSAYLMQNYKGSDLANFKNSVGHLIYRQVIEINMADKYPFITINYSPWLSQYDRLTIETIIDIAESINVDSEKCVRDKEELLRGDYRN